jgi:palmitoyl-protein thioesterase
MHLSHASNLINVLLISSAPDFSYKKSNFVYPPQQPIGAVIEYRPVVIWHGLGDNYNSSGIHNAVEILSEHYPGIKVYSVSLNDNPSSDQQLSVFGDANKQLEQTCNELSEIVDLQHGFDAIGFSQGGLFLRALVETCPQVAISNLITFGSPHMGVSELPLCKKTDWLCKKRNAFLKKQVWLDSVQKRVIPAQYFRDPKDYDNYLKYSNFLADINNERDKVHQQYRDRLANLSKFVMVSFSQDTTLVPKDSASFNDYSQTGEQIEFEDTMIYKEDRIGLKSLNEAGKIDFLSLDSDHMEVPDWFIHKIARTYIGSKLI